jgi:lipopolysaccharide transport system permease protein
MLTPDPTATPTLPITVNSPDPAIAEPRQMLRDMFRALARRRDLAWRLAVRDISAQYRT